MEAHVIEQYLLFSAIPLPSCLSASIYQVCLESSTVQTNGDIEAGRRMSLPTSSSLPDGQRDQEDQCTYRGRVCFFSRKVPCNAGGFPEEVACMPTAFTVHSGGRFFPLSRGPPLSPGPLSRARQGMSFLSGLRTMHSAALVCQGV